MQLGYPIRFARYAFLIGLLALALSGAIVFSLNAVTVRTESFQTQLTSRLSRADQPEPDESPDASPAPAPTPTQAPEPPAVNRIAARRTFAMLYPMLYYLGGTGLLWALLVWRRLGG